MTRKSIQFSIPIGLQVGIRINSSLIRLPRPAARFRYFILIAYALFIRTATLFSGIF